MGTLINAIIAALVAMNPTPPIAHRLCANPVVFQYAIEACSELDRDCPEDTRSARGYCPVDYGQSG